MMKTKKIPYYLFLFLLTAGASLILGFLSFGGMYALLPLLPLAFTAFGLSVAYEGEIYFQNIKGAFNKITGRDYLKRYLANQYLLEKFPKEEEFNSNEPLPQFFIDYRAQLLEMEKFKHVKLNAASRKRKKQLKQRLRDMENWFALQLFAKDDEGEGMLPLTPYESRLREWLKTHQQKESQDLLASRQRLYRGVQAFSVLAAVFMGIGTTYLLVGEFATIPLLATIPFGFLPAIILPMAIVAGTAYGFLTYNAITDMINNDTLRKWYRRLRDDFKQGVTVKNVFMAVTAVLLLGLATALTICTAGTWWTVAKNAQPLFGWMVKIPSFVMGVINPIITGFSALIFNLENTADSLNIIYSALNSGRNFFQHAITRLSKWGAELYARENWGQILNPFRLILKLTIVPLRILFFFGHLVSIGVTADRVPGIPEILSAILGIVSEGFEDMHYFMSHSHEHRHSDFRDVLNERLGKEHGHSHEADLPTRMLRFIFIPIYFLAALWDYGFSQLNNPEVNQRSPHADFKSAWNKQRGNPFDSETEENVVVETQPSEDWETEQALYHVNLYRQEHFKRTLLKPGVADMKSQKLEELDQSLRRGEERAHELVKNEARNPVHKTHRFFSKGPTQTEAFLEKLSKRISPAA
ncbi:hypothetical protein GH742_01450 [Legionella sp. MW5194]|uniref:hypothetical protein n=1 Tax=Legionella sp. MW5194 TaxID=2662448 RepID=UPI00193E25F4|nr:hypothetical protein [Legionella sp. MW5194]QRN02645.1 hypothetical protein GH742_01450 [Legionella sp. MW5194]